LSSEIKTFDRPSFLYYDRGEGGTRFESPPAPKTNTSPPLPLSYSIFVKQSTEKEKKKRFEFG
jgi:hypothetical protein